MIIVTTDTIANQNIVEVKGLSQAASFSRGISEKIFCQG